MTVDKIRAKAILESFAEVNLDSVTKKDNTIDLEKFQKLLEVQRRLKDLESIGVTRKWLHDNHYIEAWLVFAGMLKNE